MSNVVVAENHLTYGGVKYFRGGAQVIELLSSGEKRTPVFGENYLEPKDNIPAGHVKVSKSKVIQIDYGSTEKSAIGAAVAAIVHGVPVKFSGDDVWTKTKSGELRVVLFSVKTTDLVDAVNRSPQAMANLVEWGGNARAVHQAFFVVDGATASHFDNDAAVSLSAGAGGLQATVGGTSSSSGGTTLVLPTGCCYAYLLAEFEWNAHQKKNITRAVDANDDQWSFG